ncbi:MULTISPECIES: hypothetical protein [Streptococcus]|uniref:Uncharacterized protein n=1 Tax=Streptococcus mitis TaxID=28037 RepID=A0A1X1KA96_STRMT|nr:MULTISPECIES: hypothetical protein [Streptococcus]NIB84791.1 hypothetical protein [Streptococcus sp. CCUG 71758]ORO96343.1 hypothetical protein B7700_01080 [Streptococcus mitis]
MAPKKSQTQSLKGKLEKFNAELEKIQEQKRALNQKEKEYEAKINALQAEYIIALMAESGKSFDEFENFAFNNSNQVNSSEEVGEGHVQNY